MHHVWQKVAGDDDDLSCCIPASGLVAKALQLCCADPPVLLLLTGVYIDKSGDKELDHDVEVVGWGEEDGLKYWLVNVIPYLRLCSLLMLTDGTIPAPACAQAAPGAGLLPLVFAPKLVPPQP